MIGDGKTKYDHEFDGKSVEAGSCVSEFRNKEFSSKARITYIQKKYLKVLCIKKRYLIHQGGNQYCRNRWLDVMFSIGQYRITTRWILGI